MKARALGPRTEAARRLAAAALLCLAALLALTAPARAVTDAAPVTAAAADTDLMIVSIAELRDPVLQGDTIRYTITVKNQGPASDDAVVTAAVPAGTTFGAANPSKGTCAIDAGTIRCDLGTLAVNGTATIQVFLETETPGQVTFTAQVRGTGTDTSPANDSKTVTTTVNARPTDLAVALSSPATSSAGASFTYTAVVTNRGPVAAQDVELDLAVPAGLDVQSVTAPCTQTSGGATCDLGEMAKDATATIQLTVSAGQPGLYRVTATVSSTTPESATGDNTASSTTKVTGPPTDVALAVDDAPDPAIVGGTVTYTFTVTNLGSAAADDVTVTTTVPAGTSYEGVSGAGWTCSTKGSPVNSLSCALGSALAPSGSSTLKLSVTANQRTGISLTAQVDSAAAETNPANNAVTASTAVTANEADLRVTASGPDSPVVLGDQFTIALVATNDGPVRATGPVMRIPFPEGATIAKITPPPRGTCSAIGSELSCVLGDMAPTAMRSVVLRIRPDRLGVITVAGTVSSGTPDPNTGNNGAQGSATVVREAPQPDAPGGGGTPPPAGAPTPPAGGGGGGGPATPPPAAGPVEVSAEIAGSRIRPARGIPVEVEVDGPASVRLRLLHKQGRRTRTLGSLTRTASAAGSDTYVLRLTKSARRRIARLKAGSKLTLHVQATGADGTTTADRVTLRVLRSGRLRAA